MARKPMNKAKYKGGREIADAVLYEHWANLHRIKERILKLIEDLNRDCRASGKYDDLAQDIVRMQKLIIKQDVLQQVK